jgi:hypothetical protein
MWRFALLIGFSCSVVLNVYFFMELNIRTIENKFQKEASVHLQQRATHTKKDEVQDKKKNKEKDNYSDIEGTQSAEKSADSVKAAINAKDYFNASYLINILANDHKTELSEVRLFWLHAAQALIQQKLFTHAENSISAYLLFQRDDSDFLYQQVDLYWQQQLPLLAIRYAYEMQYHVFNEVENRAAVNFARQLVQPGQEHIRSKNSRHYFFCIVAI